MSLVISDPDYLAKVLAFADRKGLRAQLLDQLWFLHAWAERDGATPEHAPTYDGDGREFPPASWTLPLAGKNVCTLRRDSSPASFMFAMSRGLTGGLIYHGDQSGWVMPSGVEIPPGYGVETFCVAFGVDIKKTPWSVHT